MKKVPLILALCLFCRLVMGQASDEQAIRQHVVKIFSSKRSVNLSRPWERSNIKELTGSGVWLGEGRILTNAHVVLSSTQLYAQPYDSSDRFSAETEVMSPEMDLAVIVLEDSSAFEALQPLEITSDLPELRSAVQVYGYPTGGQSLSVTEGIVSRVEYAAYKYEEEGLRIQVDAALNPGNSGGPAIVNGRIAGLVFSRLRAGDNIGYLIPGEEITTFFDDVADGQYQGKPKFRDTLQRLQNDALRQRFQLERRQTGLLVVRPYECGEDYPLQADDVITHVGPHDLDNDGMVRLENGLKIRYSYFVPKLIVDGKFPATIVRDGESMTVDVPAGPRPATVLTLLKGAYPEYFVYGPLVFIEAAREYADNLLVLRASSDAKRRIAVLTMLVRMWRAESPLLSRVVDEPAFEGERLVMVAAPLLPHKISKGYLNPQGNTLDKVNGTKIKNINHLVAILRDAKEVQLKFEFADKDSEYIVFDREQVEDSMDDILINNAIVRQGSAELLTIWNGKADDK